MWYRMSTVSEKGEKHSRFQENASPDHIKKSINQKVMPSLFVDKGRIVSHPNLNFQNLWANQSLTRSQCALLFSVRHFLHCTFSYTYFLIGTQASGIRVLSFITG